MPSADGTATSAPPTGALVHPPAAKPPLGASFSRPGNIFLKNPLWSLALGRPVRSAYLDDAEPEAISHAVRNVLERRGALVSEHRHSRIRFHGLRPHTLSWTRAGYVGIYQHIGEREAEVRLLLRARWPWRILWIVAVTNVIVTIAAFATDPPGTTWSVLAILGALALIVAGIIYVATLKSVRAEEKALFDEFEIAFGTLPDVKVIGDEEREIAELEAELEGEITRRRIEANRPAPVKRAKGERFSIMPKRKANAAAKTDGDESPEARQERLLARKAELEEKLRQRRAQTSGAIAHDDDAQP